MICALPCRSKVLCCILQGMYCIIDCIPFTSRYHMCVQSGSTQAQTYLNLHSICIPPIHSKWYPILATTTLIYWYPLLLISNLNVLCHRTNSTNTTPCRECTIKIRTWCFWCCRYRCHLRAYFKFVEQTNASRRYPIILRLLEIAEGFTIKLIREQQCISTQYITFCCC